MPPSSRNDVYDRDSNKKVIRTPRIDLTVIDQAYGPDADLYVDVLRVSYLASTEDIQIAFFDRRSELFTVLSHLTQESEEHEHDEISLSQRRFAERRMDAVVLAFRILKDSNLRQEYHQVRQGRLSRRANSYRAPLQKQTTQHQTIEESKLKLKTKPKAKSKANPMEEPTPKPKSKSIAKPVVKPKLKPKPIVKPISKQPVLLNAQRSERGRSSRRREISPDDVTTSDGETFATTDDETTTFTMDDMTEDDYSMVSRDVPRSMADRFRQRSEKYGGILSCFRENSFICRCTEEIQGTVSDSCGALDQVFNVFTLQERDINAVCSRIEKATQTLNRRD